MQTWARCPQFLVSVVEDRADDLMERVGNQQVVGNARQPIIYSRDRSAGSECYAESIVWSSSQALLINEIAEAAKEIGRHSSRFIASIADLYRWASW